MPIKKGKEKIVGERERVTKKEREKACELKLLHIKCSQIVFVYNHAYM